MLNKHEQQRSCQKLQWRFQSWLLTLVPWLSQLLSSIYVEKILRLSQEKNSKLPWVKRWLYEERSSAATFLTMICLSSKMPKKQQSMQAWSLMTWRKPKRISGSREITSTTLYQCKFLHEIERKLLILSKSSTLFLTWYQKLSLFPSKQSIDSWDWAKINSLKLKICKE